MNRMNRTSWIEVCWDTQDPCNIGWAWWAYDENNELLDSGSLAGRQSCGSSTLAQRARAAAGVRGLRVEVRIVR